MPNPCSHYFCKLSFAEKISPCKRRQAREEKKRVKEALRDESDGCHIARMILGPDTAALSDAPMSYDHCRVFYEKCTQGMYARNYNKKKEAIQGKNSAPSSEDAPLSAISEPSVSEDHTTQKYNDTLKMDANYTALRVIGKQLQEQNNPTMSGKCFLCSIVWPNEGQANAVKDRAQLDSKDDQAAPDGKGSKKVNNGIEGDVSDHEGEIRSDGYRRLGKKGAFICGMSWCLKKIGFK